MWQRCLLKSKLLLAMTEKPAPFHIDCSCGQRIGLTAGKAGGAIACRCGRQLLVPTLAELRVQAGQDPYATNSVERARRLVEDGNWPLEQCLACGSKADRVLRPALVAARAYARREGPDKELMMAKLLLTVFGVFAALLAMFKSSSGSEEEPASRGHDLTLTVPLPVCNHCDPTKHWTKRRTVRKILKRVPELAAIFREFPETTVEI
jgi:hypothetical protein